jgi:hypothetical protein
MSEKTETTIPQNDADIEVWLKEAEHELRDLQMQLANEKLQNQLNEKLQLQKKLMRRM